MPPKKRRLAATVKIALEAGTANPASVGQALGPHGLNIMEFCKAYNDRTQNSRGEVVPAVISVFEDRSFDFVLRTPPASALLLKAASLNKGSAEPAKNKVGRVDREQLRAIAERKQEDLNANDVDSAIKIIAGTARSMGITVVD
ncbi:MAG: 50S ribosomal protein L11 [Pseudonocardiaceae bacterium]|nr:50S ribosomal protein L11 [Pseudonocardiaceae bacterium]